MIAARPPAGPARPRDDTQDAGPAPRALDWPERRAPARRIEVPRRPSSRKARRRLPGRAKCGRSTVLPEAARGEMRLDACMSHRSGRAPRRRRRPPPATPPSPRPASGRRVHAADRRLQPVLLPPVRPSPADGSGSAARTSRPITRAQRAATPRRSVTAITTQASCSSAAGSSRAARARDGGCRGAARHGRRSIAR